MALNKYTVQESNNLKLGQGGWDYVSAATVNSHTYIAITVLKGAEASAGEYASGTVTATSVDTNLGDSLSSAEIPVGTTIYGRWSSVTIGASDIAIVYRG